MKRKRRPGEVVCRCGAYRFPHRRLGGACKGRAFIADTFERELHGACRDCAYREAQEHDGYELRCQVLDGRDKELQCPELQEHIRFEGIRLYGVNKPARSHGLHLHRA